MSEMRREKMEAYTDDIVFDHYKGARSKSSAHLGEGKTHLNYIVSSFVEYYNTFRQQQGLENIPLSGTVPVEQSVTVDPDEVVCQEWLGGVLKHYERKAA